MSDKKPLYISPNLVKRFRSALTVYLLGPFSVFILLTVIYLFLLIGELGRYFDEEMLLFFIPILVPLVLCWVGFVQVRKVLKELLDEMSGTISERPKLERMPSPEAFKETEEKQVVETVKGFQKDTQEQSAIDKYKEMEDSWRKKKEVPTNYKEPQKVQKPINSVSWEEWVGKKLLQKLGIAVVLIGMLVFLKYSFDNGLIGPNGRIALSVLSGCVLLGLGEWFQSKYRYWSQTFTGGALALLYFTVFAARNFYAGQLMIDLTRPMAMALFCLITAIGALASVRYKSQTIAWFTVLGGYLTPILISSGQNDPVGLSLYLALLTVGILALSAFEKWKYLNLAAFVLTQVYMFGVVYPDETFAHSWQIFASVGFFFVFGALPLLYQFRLRLPAQADDVLLIALNGLAVFSAVTDAVGGIDSQYIGLVSLILALVYVLYSMAALRRCGNDPALVNTYLLASVILIALALLSELKDWVAVGWVPLSVLLLYLTQRIKQKGPLYCAFPLLIGGLIFLLGKTPFSLPSDMYYAPFTSDFALQSYIVFACLLLWVIFSKKIPEQLLKSAYTNSVTNFVHVIVAALLFAFVTFEVSSHITYFDWTVDVPLTTVYLVFVVIAMAIYNWLRVAVWLIVALLVQGLVLLFALTNLPYSDQAIVHPWAIASLAGLAVTGGMVYNLLNKETSKPSTNYTLPGGLITVALAHVWIHVTVEIINLQPILNWSDQLATRVLSGWWIAYSFVFMAWYLHQNKNELLKIGLALLTIPFCKDLILIFSNSPYLSELNMFYETGLWTVISLGLVIYGAKNNLSVILKYGLCTLGILAAIDMLAHNSSGFITTIWWSLAALVTMAIGFNQQNSLVRKVAIGLFLTATVKLLLFDFSNLETGVRIASSIVIGLLMIGASYFYQRFEKLLEDK